MNPAAATPPPAAEPTAADKLEALLVVVRESPGSDKRDEALVPMAKLQVDLPGGIKAEMSPAWFELIGDMHVRLVFDQGETLRTVRTEELAELGLGPEAAIARGLANLERLHGAPESVPWHGLMRVQGRAEDFASSYFLDRGFWRALLERHPEGLVVAVPQHGGLLWTPAGDMEGVAALESRVGALHDAGQAQRLSSAVYLFKDDGWTVRRPARPAAPAN